MLIIAKGVLRENKVNGFKIFKVSMGEDFINDRRDTEEDIDNIRILKLIEGFKGDDLKRIAIS